ncbi:L-threonylcarbamoyladenylate synthase [Salirhabdus sp. Marseille-P4669]|uniref:L-threonylcarbamoyladenylate synthase n=1 Tax=Salirhabdus sp. Marseille-P4669 TaxID=2042310 RepID=UPI000C79DC9E|nr:L-threonylcarbamoyladenylate synthase [Salirhabdus sp. Marseille-P4669]
MDTKYWDLQNIQVTENNSAIQQAAEAIQHKHTVAFPTETVYGLGADATSEEAVDKIFKAKGRPSDNPLIVHIGEQKQVEQIVSQIPEKAVKLMDAFWPGPLTIILKSNGACAENVTAGLDSVGVRFPDHPVAIALLKASGKPVAAPSANQSGRPSPTTAEHVLDDLSGKIYGVLDGGPTGVGVESTVVDCTGDLPVILRPGGVTKEEMEQVVGPVLFDVALKNNSEKPKAPGMKYTHYAPNAPLWLVEGSVERIKEVVSLMQQEGKRVGVMVSEENRDQFQDVVVKTCGHGSDLSEVAKHIYDVLRAFNKEDVDIIIGQTYPKEGVGVAVMNRLEKAATKMVK